jgi:hypothetical protein
MKSETFHQNVHCEEEVPHDLHLELASDRHHLGI